MDRLNQELPKPIATEHTATNLEAALSPDEVKLCIRDFHAMGITTLKSAQLDKLILGAPSRYFDQQLLSTRDQEEWYKHYRSESVYLGGRDSYWTPYGVIKKVIRELDLGADDVLYDLGAGYGRMVLYAAITTPAICRGIEIMEERVEVSRAAKGRLQLDNAELIAGDVLEQDFSDGNIFYLFCPFPDSVLVKVKEALQQLANIKPITIVARGTSSECFEVDWLRHVKQVEDGYGDYFPVDIFTSH